MSVTRDEILKVADLAKLQFDEADLETFTAQFQRILNYMEKLREVDVSGIAPTTHVSLAADIEKHALREDEVRPSLPSEEAMGNAPEQDYGHYKVPKVI